MTRWWTHLVADVGDWFPGGLYGLALALLLLAVAVGLALQPFELYRFRRKTSSDKPRQIADIVPAETEAAETLPELPADALLERARQLMATGDYRGAVREWLRVCVRDLVERGVVEHRPGWTVTELARSAGQALPPAAGALDEAARRFSDVWYGGHLADLATAARMRDLHAAIRDAAAAHPPAVSFTMEGS